MQIVGFWRDKRSCWEMLGCPEEVSSQCIARREPERPCWEYLETQCKKVLELLVECKDCKVFKLYGGRAGLTGSDVRDPRVI